MARTTDCYSASVGCHTVDCVGPQAELFPESIVLAKSVLHFRFESACCGMSANDSLIDVGDFW